MQLLGNPWPLPLPCPGACLTCAACLFLQALCVWAASPSPPGRPRGTQGRSAQTGRGPGPAPGELAAPSTGAGGGGPQRGGRVGRDPGLTSSPHAGRRECSCWQARRWEVSCRGTRCHGGGGGAQLERAPHGRPVLLPWTRSQVSPASGPREPGGSCSGTPTFIRKTPPSSVSAGPVRGQPGGGASESTARLLRFLALGTEGGRGSGPGGRPAGGPAARSVLGVSPSPAVSSGPPHSPWMWVSPPPHSASYRTPAPPPAPPSRRLEHGCPGSLESEGRGGGAGRAPLQVSGTLAKMRHV